jgi:hypothetical protein
MKIRLKYVNAFQNRRRKNGELRYYFRRRGFKAVPLPGLPGSEEFMATYQTALSGLPDQDRAELGASRTEPGSINALAVSTTSPTSGGIWRKKPARPVGASSNVSAPNMATSGCGFCNASTS